LIGSSSCARVPLGWWSLLPAGPDIHLLPQAPKSCRRRLSLCSLPVPKQSEGGIGSCLPRPGGQLQDLAACASNNSVFVLPYQEGFFKLLPCRPTLRPARSPVSSGLPPACRPPASGPQRAWPDSCSPAGVPFPEQGPVRGSSGAPAWCCHRCCCAFFGSWQGIRYAILRAFTSDNGGER